MSRYYKDNIDELVRIRYDNKCCNCGTTENLNIHHIVPKKRGGTDELNNLVLVCTKCHQGIHFGRNVALYRNHKNDGRKRIKRDDSVFWDYIHAEITSREAAEALGYSKGTHISDMANFKDFMKDNNISKLKRVRNYSTITFDDGRDEVWHMGFKI